VVGLVVTANCSRKKIRFRWCGFGGVTVCIWWWWCEFGKEKVSRREKWELLSWSGSGVDVEYLGRNERNETLVCLVVKRKWEERNRWERVREERKMREI
jgi:hypothetical protein